MRPVSLAATPPPAAPPAPYGPGNPPVFGDTEIADLTDPSRYERYLADYLEGARRCRTPAELRAYGRPADCRGFHDGEREMGAAYRRAHDAYDRTCRAVSDDIDRVEGRRSPFSFRLAVDVEAVLSFFGGEAGFSRKAGEGFGWRAGTSSSVRTRGGEIEHSASAAGATAGLSRQPGGRVESIEVAIPAFGPVSSYGVLRRDALEVGLAAGGSLGGEDAPVRLEGHVRAGIDVALVTPGFVARAIAPGSWFDAPPRPPASAPDRR